MAKKTLLLIALFVLSLVVSFGSYLFILREVESFGSFVFPNNVLVHPENSELFKIEKVNEFSGFITEIDYNESANIYTLKLYHAPNGPVDSISLPELRDEAVYSILGLDGEMKNLNLLEFISKLRPSYQLFGSMSTSFNDSNYTKINYLHLTESNVKE